MECSLRQLDIHYMLNDETPLVPSEFEATPEEIDATFKARSDWIVVDYKCHHLILETLFDILFNQFSKKTKTAKELQEVVVKVYKGEVVGSKKFHVQIEYKMVDSMSVLEQTKDFQKIVDAITTAGTSLNPLFHINMLISKLSPYLQDYKTNLMHEQDDMDLDILMHHLHVKELARNKGKKLEPTKKAHVVETKPKSRFSHKRKEFKKFDKDKKNPYEKCYESTKTRMNFYVYGKIGHLKSVCLQRKNDNDRHTKKKNKGKRRVQEDEFSTIAIEANMAGEEADQWIDISDTRHICGNRTMFTTYQLVGGGINMFMGNSSSSQFIGKGTMELQFTSRKMLPSENSCMSQTLGRISSLDHY